MRKLKRHKKKLESPIFDRVTLKKDGLKLSDDLDELKEVNQRLKMVLDDVHEASD